MLDSEKKLVRLYAAGAKEYKKEILNIYDYYLGSGEDCVEMQYLSEIFSPVADPLLKIELKRMMGIK